MSKKYRATDWKTTTFLILSITLHAGLIYYIAVTQFNFGKDPIKTSDLGMSAAIEITPAIEAKNQTEKVSESIKPEPVITKTSVKKEIAKTLPKKDVILPAPKIGTKPQVTTQPNAEESLPPEVKSEEIPTIAAATIDVQKEQEEEQKAREQLAEKILNENEPSAPGETPDEKAEPVEAEPEQVAATIIDSKKAEKEEQQPALAPISNEQKPTTVTPATTPTNVGEKADSIGAATNKGSSEKTSALPIKNDFELRALPGNKDPQYPTADRLAKRQGEVKFMAEVAADGTISDIRILKSSGHKSLDLTAYETFKQYKYMPGQQSYVVKSFVFTLKGPAQVLPSRLAVRQQPQQQADPKR